MADAGQGTPLANGKPSTTDGAVARRALAPLWFRFVFGSFGVALWILIFTITFAAFAWRATQPPWLLPTALVVEMAILLTALTFGRRWRKRAMYVVHGWTRRNAVRLAALAVFILVVVGTFIPDDELSTRPAEPSEDRKVAVVGAGAAGVHAAWMLDQAGVDFTLYEAAETVGGHAHTVDFETADGGTFPVDIGYIFGSARGYEEMKALLAHHGIERHSSKLSYTSNVHGVEWATDAPETLDPEAVRFHKLADERFGDASLNTVPFGWWLRYHGFDDDFREQYLTPILVVLFITTEGIYEQSTRFVLGMMSGRTKFLDFRFAMTGWTVEGGSSRYYQRVTAAFRDRIRLSEPVTKVARIHGRVRVTSVSKQDGVREELYDDVILAIPADVALEVIEDPLPLESLVLSEVRYFDSTVALHSDERVLPREEMRRNYNFHRSEELGGEFELSGQMAAILGDGRPVEPAPIVTLNPRHELEDERVRRVWRHHVMDVWHLALTSEMMPSIQGRGHIWYAGEWVKYAGHWSTIETGIAAACKLGPKAPKPIPDGARCYEFDVQDELPWLDREAETVRICGEEGLYNFMLEETCHVKLPPELTYKKPRRGPTSAAGRVKLSQNAVPSRP